MSTALDRIRARKIVTNLLLKFHNERNETFLKGRRLLLFLTIYQYSPMSQEEIKIHFPEMSQTVLSQDLTMICESGYITRTSENDMDKRQKSYELTDRGWDVVEEWMEAAVKDSESE